jgi:O-antigen ligase
MAKLSEMQTGSRVDWLSLFLQALLALAGAVSVFILSGAGPKWLLLYVLILGAAGSLLVLGRHETVKSVLLIGIGFSLIINPHKSFGPLDLEHFGGVHGFFVSLTDLAMFCLVALNLVWYYRHSDLRMTRPPGAMLVALGCYLLAMLLSLLGAHNHVLALGQVFFELKCILFFLLLGFWLVPTEGERVKVFILMLLGVILGVLVETAVAVCEFKGWLPTNFSMLGIQAGGYMETLGPYAATRVGGTYRHPNYLAVPMAVLLPVFAAMFLAFKAKLKVVSGVTLLCLVLTLILTLSRAGFVAAVAIMLIFILLALRRQIGRKVLKRNLAIIILIAIGLSVALSFYAEPIYFKIFRSDPLNIQSRVDLNAMAMEMIIAHPILGIGINNYTTVGKGFSFFYIYETAFNLPPVVHNIYLLIASEIGLPGLFFFVWFIVLVFRQGLRGLRVISDELTSLLLCGFTAGLFGYLLSDMWGLSLRKLEIGYLFWWHAGMIVFLVNPGRAKLVSPEADK